MSKIVRIIKRYKHTTVITHPQDIRNALAPHQDKIREISKSLSTIAPGSGDELVSTYFQDYDNLGKKVIVAHLTHVDGSPVSEDYQFTADPEVIK